ncbi:MAG: phenylalanine--tRNA ligase subunit beta [Thermodesulfobacteriota bacterium]
MPTILVDLADLARLVGDDYPADQVEADLELVKGELKGADPATGRTKIELNDTNRPDLWSAAGIARQLRARRRGRGDAYKCFTDEPGGKRILVDARATEVRPYVAGFLARGPAVTEDSLAELIQSQEKLCDGYGARRKTVSVGIYRAEKIRFPVRYRMVAPRGARFVPLGMDDELDLQQILERHPKGIEYAHILAGAPVYPLLEDGRGGILSFPPIINSRAIGEVVPGDRELFVEATGTDLRAVLLIENVLAVDLADRGWEVEPVVVEYAFDTPFGREVRAPYPLTNELEVPTGDFARLLGEPLPPDEIERLLTAYGCDVELRKGRTRVATAPYRQDYMHPVDAVEDLAIAIGVNHLSPVWPERFTPGRLARLTLHEDRVRELMIGLGFEEIIANVLCSRADVTTRLGADAASVVALENPMSESYAALRPTLLASLLAVEERSAKTAYPHRVFEVGEVVVPDPGDPHASRTTSLLGALVAHPSASFSDAHSVLSYLGYYLDAPAELRPLESGTFLPGRAAEVLVGGRAAGHLGELHPEVLERWGVRMPVAYLELRLDALLAAAR